jgi:hypothetical protein
MPTVGSKVGVYKYVVRRQVDYPFCTRATKATPFEYQGYSKATESGYSVIRALKDRHDDETPPYHRQWVNKTYQLLLPLK